MPVNHALAIMRAYLTALLLTISLFWQVAGAEEGIPKNANACDLQEPLKDAGENGTHGLLVKIFPRKSSVGDNYTGCQNFWAQSDGKWSKFLVMYYEGGRMAAWWSLDDKPNSAGLLCRLKNDRLVDAQPEACYVPADLGLGGSYAPGCMQRAATTGRMDKACSKSLDSEG